MTRRPTISADLAKVADMPIGERERSEARNSMLQAGKKRLAAFQRFLRDQSQDPKDLAAVRQLAAKQQALNRYLQNLTTP